MMQKPPPRWLLLSLVLNIFLIGAIAGGGIVWWRSTMPPTDSMQRRFAGDQLDSAKREAFRQALRGVRIENRALARQSRAGKREVAQLLAAPTLDTRALDAAMAQVRDADFQLRARMEAQSSAFLATLPVEDRRKLSASLTQRLEAHGRR